MSLTLAYARAELTRLLRLPAYWLPVIFFPVLLYSFFGAANARDEQYANLFMASWSVFAVLGIALFQFGVSMAVSRESPWEGFVRTLPTGPGPRFGAQIIVAILFSSAAGGLVWIAANLMSPVTLSAGEYLQLAVSMLTGAVPFALMGLWIAYAMPPRGAVPIANLLYLVLAFLGGLWVPPDNMPGFVQIISEFVPTRHYAELAWSAALNRPFPVLAVHWLVGYAILFGWLASRAYKKDEAKRYG